MNKPIKIFYSFLLLASSFPALAQTFNSDLIKYTRTIFKQAATGEIQVFDSLMRKLPADSLYNKYISAQPSMADNLSENFYTKNTFKEAAFIKNFHYGFFEGLMGLPDLPTFLFDTLTYKPNPNYIIFRINRYNDDGSFKDKKKLFIVNRSVQTTDKKLILNKAIKQSKDSLNRKNAKLLTTNSDEYWCIDELLVNNKKTDLDICQSKYHLKLNADMHFEQLFIDETSFDINKKAGIDSGIERGFYYLKGKQHVQCYLENEKGVWTYNNGHLLLMTNNGILLGNYKMTSMTKSKAEILTKQYKIRLKKVSSI